MMEGALRKHILPALGDLPLDMVDERRVQEFITRLKTTVFERRAKDGHLTKRYKLSRSTIHNYVKVVKRVVGKKVWMSWDLKLGKPEAPKQRFFTERQMLDIIDCAAGLWKTFFTVLGGTGMRIGELCGLDVVDLDLANCVIYVRRSYLTVSNSVLPTKTVKGTREIDIDAGLAQLLKEHIGERTSGLVFQSAWGTPWRAGNIIKRVLNPILDQLGIPRGGKVTHAFRHGRVMVLRKNNVPGDLQRQWIGHSSLTMTDQYSHIDEDLDYRRKYAGQLGLKRVQ
jgi:integrase